MKISVIIPTLNRKDYVLDLLDDLSKQSLTIHEVIISDQSSVFEKIESTYPFELIHFKHTGKGPCCSRNDAASMATAEVLVFLDDDARINPEFIQELTNPIFLNDFKATAGAICDKNGNYLKNKNDFLKGKSYNFIKVLTTNPDDESKRVTLSFPAGCSAISKSVFFEVGGFDVSFDPSGAAEDRDLAFNLYYNGYAVFYNGFAKLNHLGATVGGSRGFESRTEMLDVNTYKICKKYFSIDICENLKYSIIRFYKIKLIKSVFKIKGFNSSLQQYRRIIKQLNS